ncbi:DUF3376 domain-containing protein [Mycobacterium sp. MBM]|nr:DUF3376 domain-containing protein [Mycobacterium sp. MBM]
MSAPIGGDVPKDLRYALVLNGGVSLAVWMGGVAHELNSVRLASELTPKGSTSRVLRAWRRILDEIDATVMIDIIAGTSAGGLNGAVLATAIARGADLPDMRAMWKEVASLSEGRLTRADSAGCQSILDGGYFHDQVVGTLADITPAPGIQARPCALVLTATALNSPPTELLLEDGAVMRTVDGRRLYRFRREPAEEVGPGTDGHAPTRNDFDDFPEALALGARASASFPVAFEPVWESAELSALRIGADDGVEDACWLADGGLLDNAPFEPALRDLVESCSVRAVERTVLYITPGVPRQRSDGGPRIPPKLTTTAGWVFAAMREPDERLDRDALSDIFGRMALYEAEPFILLRDYLSDPDRVSLQQRTEWHAAATVLFSHYLRNRAIAEKKSRLARSGLNVSPLAPPDTQGGAVPTDGPGMPSSMEASTDGVWRWGVPAAARVLRWWALALSDIAVAATDGVDLDALVEVADSARAQAEELWSTLVASTSGDQSPMTEEMQQAALRDFYGSPGGAARRLHELIDGTADAFSAHFSGVTGSELIQLALDLEVISGVFGWTASEFNAPRLHYQNLTPAAPSLVDVGAVQGKMDWYQKKLYGERWGHFGAFSSPEAREHDWLWGRIDGASQLSTRLLKHARVPKSVRESLQKELLEAILESENRTHSDVVDGAHAVYTASPQALLATMYRSDGGRSIQSLLRTICDLVNPGGGAAKVARWVWIALAPEWPPREGPKETLRVRILGRCLRLLVRRTRRRFIALAVGDDTTAPPALLRGDIGAAEALRQRTAEAQPADPSPAATAPAGLER